MAKRKILRLSLLLELLLDLTLTVGFIIQAFLIGCLLLYGYLPLPAGLVNRIINEKAPDGITIEVDDYKLQTNGTIHAVGIKVRTSDIRQSLFEAESAEVELTWQGLSEKPKPESLVISDGTIFIPSIYSPNGSHAPLFERMAFRIQPNDTGFVVDRFAAMHDMIRLRGATDLTFKTERKTELSPQEAVKVFYTQAAKVLQQKDRIRHFETPTIDFNSVLAKDGSWNSFVRISSHELDHPEIKAKQIQLKTHLSWDGRAISTIQPPTFTASSLRIHRYKIFGEGVCAEIPAESISAILKGVWPQIRLWARSLNFDQLELDAPIFTVDPSELPQLQFSGATRSSNGAIDLRGQLNIDNWSGKVRARGSVDLAKLAREKIPNRFPSIHFEEAPYLDLDLDFDENFSLKNAQLCVDAENVIVEELRFDHIRANGSFQGSLYCIEDLYLQRQKQWLDLKFSLDTQSNDYRVTLIGTAVPHEYNSILPDWWAAIFKDFDFSKNSYSHGNFIIYGNTARKSPNLYFGHAQAQGVSYRNVFLEDSELIVRGRGPYTELHKLRARSGEGWVHGDIRFASKGDEIKGPASIRLKLEAKLALEDAAKLFGDNISEIIEAFETDALPLAKIECAIFNKACPEYAEKSFFDLGVSCNQPIIYEGIKLDHLNLDLYGRKNITHLRDIQFGYADGNGQAAIDVYAPEDSETSVRYKLKLVDADQNQAISNLPQLDNIEGNLGTIEGKKVPNEEREEARADIEIHGEGPLEDIFAHNGYGKIEIRSEKLGTIQLLGTLSRILQSTQLNFTTFNLNLLRGTFQFTNEYIDFKVLKIDGPLTQIDTQGTLNLKDQSLNMRISVNLLKNARNPIHSIRKIREFITKQIPNFLEFELTGTIQKQKLRSLYDPRNLIPIL